MSAEPVLLPIASLVLDEKLRPRVRIDADAVMEYTALQAAGVSFPPCRVVRLPDGKYLLAAGWLRVHAAKLNNKRHVPCLIQPGTWTDALSLATQDNSANAFRLSPLDQRHATLALLADPTFSGWSDEQIARHIGTLPALVSAVRVQQLMDASQPDPAPAKSAPPPDDEEADELEDADDEEQEPTPPEPRPRLNLRDDSLPPTKAEKAAAARSPRKTREVDRVGGEPLLEEERSRLLTDARKSVAKLCRIACRLGVPPESLLEQFRIEPRERRWQPAGGEASN